MRRHKMSWLAHTLVDVALGIGLLIAGLHGSGDGYLVLDAAAAYLILVTLVTDAPGAIRRWLSRLTHRLSDMVVAVALLASPLLLMAAHAHLDAFATAMAEAVGVILLRDGLVTDHRPRPGLRTGPDRAEAIDVVAHEPDHRVPARPTGPSRMNGLARGLGRASAGAAGQVPEVARKAGAATAQVRRVGRAAREAAREAARQEGRAG